MELAFIKAHGSQNDFFIIDEIENERVDFSDDFRKQLAVLLCHRKNALGGADGVLYISNSRQEDVSYKMQVVNADGSIASMCGNGLRTVARYVLEKTNQRRTKIETMKATLEISEFKSLGHHIPTYQVEISPVLFAKEALKMNYHGETLFNTIWSDLDPNLRFSAVAVPNPHLIAFVDKDTLDSDKQKKLAVKLNSNSSFFEDGVNVSFVQRLSPEKIFVRTFERGVGFTNACGTAMSAASLIKKCLDHDKLGDIISVYNDGGLVNVTASQDEKGRYKIHLIGNATFTAKGNVNINGNSVQVINIEETMEQENYLRLVQDVSHFLLKNR